MLEKPWSPYLESLKAICNVRLHGVAPYVLRSRVERALFGALVGVLGDAGRKLSGLSRAQIESAVGPGSAEHQRAVARDVARVFEKFTYLCDTSNWSDDGQDPRLDSCREDLLAICARIEGFEKSGS